MMKQSPEKKGDSRSSMSSPANVKHSGSTPLGFLGSTADSLTSSPLTDHRLMYGEELRTGEGTLSAPPPPGFSVGPEERAKIVWNSNEADIFSNFDTRTTSYTNLAAMIGTGLADSMEDSTRDRNGAGRVGGDLSSYARQTRHSASRLIGATSAGSSPTLLNLGLGRPSITQGSNAGSGMAPKRISDPCFLANQDEVLRGHSGLGEPRMYTDESDDLLSGFRASINYRSHLQPPMGIFSHNESYDLASTEIGITVMEPDVGRSSAPPQLIGEQNVTPVMSRTSTPVISRQGTPDIGDLQRGMHAMDMGSASRSVQSEHSASEAELDPFVWDVYHSEPSRALAILRATTLPLQEIRASCETFGVLEVFRADFSERGIIFVSYFDIRSAQYAALELRQSLRQLAPDRDVNVMYCVPMNSSSTHDESTIVLSDLPYHIGENSLMDMLSSYGSVRSLHLQPGAHYGGKTFIAEFHNIQDAKLALLEIESSQPFGPEVIVEIGARRAVDRKRGRELLSVIGRWRHAGSRQTMQHRPNQTTHSGIQGFGSAQSRGNFRMSSTSHPRSPDRSSSPPYARQEPYNPMFRSESEGNSNSSVSQQTTQLVLGPDGRYSYVSVNSAAFPPPQQQPSHFQAPVHHHQQQHLIDHHSGMRLQHHPPQGHSQQRHHQQVVHGPHGSYLTSVPSNQHQASQAYWNHGSHHTQQQQQYRTVNPPPNSNGNISYDGTVYSQAGSSNVPYYAHVINTQTDSSVSSGSQSNNIIVVQSRRPAPPPVVEEKQDNRHLTLEIDAVESGRDTRTSLMVRNIPNKYTQQMLLSEFTENGHGPGKIDFFYLPIDFKNKCNRGYAFINFVDYKDIVSFHRQYFGQHWRVFNSDKICDITYARIQGKAGMLKRFENSALMEKDEEYKPLVFVSKGIERGKRLPFPSAHGS